MADHVKKLPFGAFRFFAAAAPSLFFCGGASFCPASPLIVVAAAAPFPPADDALSDAVLPTGVFDDDGDVSSGALGAGFLPLDAGLGLFLSCQLGHELCMVELIMGYHCDSIAG